MLKKLLSRSLLKIKDINPDRDDERYKKNFIGKNVHLGSTTLNGMCAIDDNVYFKGDILIGKYSTIGRECIIYGGNIQIGNYCQFGPRIAIYAINHPTNHITTYVNNNLFDGDLKSFAKEAPVEIGNDVWIGYGAIVLPGVKIGNGAIIGAGAVVAKDVYTYGVAVGNPACIVKTRFDPELIQLLNKWKWWNLDPKELSQYRDLFCLNILENNDIFKNNLMKILAESDKSYI
jgi:acetyltransferase-like isoleucine patch superfamily enzyme